jgi:hypothetical protein
MRSWGAIVLCAMAACSAQTGSETPPDAGEVAVDSAPDAMVEQGGDEQTGDEPELEPPTSTPLQLVPGCTAKAMIGGYPTWLFFTRPANPCNGTPGGVSDFNAVMELVRLIKSVPAGGRIDGHIYSLTIDLVGEALLAAQTRGVDVRLSVDGAVAASTDQSKTMYLDKINGIVYCTSTANTACVSSVANAVSNPKLFVFSRASTPDDVATDNVVWFGSANPTLASGADTYNNTVTIYGDLSLYTPMRAYLDDLRLKKRFADYYNAPTDRGYVQATAADAFMSPEADTDLVLTRLNQLMPTAACEVRVMQGAIRDTRLDVVKRLVEMKRGGCKVSVVAAAIGVDALAALKAANIPTRQSKINDKVFVIYGQYAAGFQYIVFSGSHNLSGVSNKTNDEVLVRLAPETGAAHPVYDEFLRHFLDAYELGTAF